MTTATQLILGIGSVCVALAAIGVAVRAVWKAWRKVDAFLEDWNGEPARAGRQGRPGIPARVSGLEIRVDALEARRGQ
jgi:hypothetical protein